MAKHMTGKVGMTEEQIDQALLRASTESDDPRAIHVDYRPGLDLLILKMSDGHRLCLPREDLEGLQNASKQDVAQVEILGGGTGLHWPSLDVDLYVPALLHHIYGTRRWMAQLGRRGGTAKSIPKAAAAKANGLKGGRPKRKQLVLTA
ncbi:DUF2442 domain-containing protein [soil metagenome]